MGIAWVSSFDGDCGIADPDPHPASVFGRHTVISARIHAFSEASSTFLWVWLPREAQPVPAGRLYRGTDGRHDFGYMSDYLERPNAVALGPDLPSLTGMRSLSGPGLSGTLRDALPGSWGRQVTRALQLDRSGANVDTGVIGDIGYGLLAGTDGIGALSYQASATRFEPRSAPQAELEILAEAVEQVQLSQPLAPARAAPLIHAVSVGGARPKASVDVDGRPCIARFASVKDRCDRLRAEFIALRLARLCQIDVPLAELRRVGGHQVLLVERFDRDNDGLSRRLVISGQTLIGHTGQRGSHAGWPELADALTQSDLARNLENTLKEMFRRMAFGILLGDTDSPVCNTLFFWDGRHVDLAPAHSFPLSNLELGFGRESEGPWSRRRVQIARLLEHAPRFDLDIGEATDLVGGLIDEMSRHTPKVRSEAEILETSQGFLIESAFGLLRPQTGKGVASSTQTTSCLSGLG